MKRSSKSYDEEAHLGHSSCPKMREKAMILERETPPQKKQVRRRLHTRKPYQEKLLNMAEARREIVTALKLHRASMKHKVQPDEAALPQNNNIFYNSQYYNYCWAVAPPPPMIFQENVDFVLPDRTLGLNLNLEDFVTSTPSSIYSPSTSSSSPPPPPPSAASEVVVDQIGRLGFVKSDEELVSSPFDEVMEIPWWVNANENYLEQHVDDFSNFRDPALPCMDIEEIEGMDGDWLA
ncbi:hypothetical protein ACS0TY_022357 [Phlomoides rotata]